MNDVSFGLVMGFFLGLFVAVIANHFGILVKF